ncbi:MAG: NUDIX domain-containing protein [Cyanobacteria bacterium P01_C01_bin.118]
MDQTKQPTNQTPMCSDELIDIVDKDDNVIGQKQRSVIIQEQLSNYRVINAFLINAKGELWIPRRTPHKTLFPSGLDVSVGGYVGSGESYEMALIRELREELNLELDQVSYRSLGHLSPYIHDCSSFMTVYEIQYEHSPIYNPHDFSDACWIKPKALMDKVNQEKYLPKSDLIKLVILFYL